MAPPRVHVTAPPVQPYRFGLQSVLLQPPPPAHFLSGVEFQSNACGTASAWPDPCGATPPEDTRTVTVTFTAVANGDDEADVTVAATVDGGDARDVSVVFDGEAPVVITTGAGAAPLGTVPDTASYAASATDITRNVTEAGSLVIDADGDGSLELELEVVDPHQKTVTDGRPTTTGDPFTTYAALKCKLVHPDDMRDDVSNLFAMGEARAIEAAFWTGAVGNSPALATSTPTVLPAASSITAAVAALEKALADSYGGIGVIHAPRAVNAYAAAKGLVVRDKAATPVLRTPLDTLWAFGAGYDAATGPTGEPAAVLGETWLYATGAVTLFKGEVNVKPDDGSALDGRTNEVLVLAERTNVMTLDCDVFAIRVRLEEDESTVLFSLTNTDITASGQSAAFNLRGMDSGFLSVFATGSSGTAETLAVVFEQQDADGNWIVTAAPTALTSAPNYTYANLGDAPGGYVFTGMGRVRWVLTGTDTPTFTGVDISVVGK